MWRNGPRVERKSMMRLAIAGPMRGRRSSSAALAVFRLILASEGVGAVACVLVGAGDRSGDGAWAASTLRSVGMAFRPSKGCGGGGGV